MAPRQASSRPPTTVITSRGHSEVFIKVGKKYEILGKSKKEIVDRYGQ